MTVESHLPEPYSITEMFKVIELREGENNIVHQFDDMDEAKAAFDSASERGDALLSVTTLEVFASQGVMDARELVLGVADAEIGS